MSCLQRLLEHENKAIYGYGVGLMFDFYIKDDLAKFECIIDDDPSKDGLGYKNLPVKVKHLSEFDLPEQSIFLVTSLENQKKITNKILRDLYPLRILSPGIIS